MKYILSLFLVPLSVYANINSYADTAGVIHNAPYSRTGIPSFIRIYATEPESNTDALIESELLNPSTAQPGNRVDRKALFHFLRSDKLKKAALDRRIAYRLYSRLAGVFARMKMYPLAMQYYFKTSLLSNRNNDPALTGQGSNYLLPEFVSSPDNAALSFANETESALPGDFLSVRYQDTCYQNSGLLSAAKKRNSNSVPVSNTDISNCFDDGKPSVAYAIIIHVKQPITGKRKPFTRINNVGHMFITLVKYNTDSSVVSRSFGFYPHKDYLFSGTPLRPATSSVFKNDALHDWDESIGKFISEKRFKKMIRLISHYENRIYHLNKNNCTDFGLYAADIAGIIVEQSNGTWPFGSGNNPANAGQSILEGKFKNADTGNTDDLFVCTDGNE